MMKRGYSPREERVVREKKKEEEGLFFARWMKERMGESRHRMRVGSESSKVRTARAVLDWGDG